LLRDGLAFPAGLLLPDAGVRDLADEMFEYLRKEKPGEALNRTFETLPEPVISPREAYMKIVTNQVEFMTSDDLAGRITANSLIPLSPGHSDDDVRRTVRSCKFPADLLSARFGIMGKALPRFRACYRRNTDRGWKIPGVVHP